MPGGKFDPNVPNPTMHLMQMVTSGAHVDAKTSHAAGLLDALLPKYVNSRLFNAMLQAAASELAARQKAMKSATDNADELIKKYTRIANQARQAGITQEISEIVGGVNALADANAGQE